MLIHHVLHIVDVVVEDAYPSFESRDVGVYLLLLLDVVVDDFVIVLSEESIDFAHICSQPVHVLGDVVLPLVLMAQLLIDQVYLFLQARQLPLVGRLILTLPGLRDGYTLIDLIKHPVTTLLLVEARLHILKPLG